MKKIVAGFLAGILVMVAGQALAGTASIIGKKVDSEAAVYINGEKVSNAIIIQGKSYAPARDVAETLGANVEWKGSENSIVITSNNELNFEVLMAHSRAKANVSSTKQKIERIENSIAKTKEDIESYNGLYREFLENRLVELENELKEEKAKLAQYEKELAELEASKQESTK